MRLMARFGLFFGLILFLVSAGDAYAAIDYISRFKKPMPEIQKMPEKDFLEMTEVKEAKPYGEKSLAHAIRIPKDWVKSEEAGASNFQISDKLLTKLSVYFAPPSVHGQERLEVKAVSIDFDMTAEQWLFQTLMATGRTTEGYTKHSNDVVEAMLLVMEGDVSYVLRMMIILNGKHVFVAEQYTPMDVWDQQAGLQERMVQSFKMLHPGRESVVKKKPYQILDIAQMDYPDTWEEKPDALTSVEKIGVKFYNYLYPSGENAKKTDKPTVEGRIDLLLVANWATVSLQDEVDSFKKSVEINDLLIGDRIEVIDWFKYYKTVTFGATESYKVISNSDNTREYEFWFTLMTSGSYYYFVSLMTPSRNDDYKTWVKNTQSYRLIVENLRPSIETKPQ